MTILKVQFLDEIRRVTLEKELISLADLESKIRLMFPQLRSFTMSIRSDDSPFFDVVQITSDEALREACAKANSRQPPILRILITSVPESTPSEEASVQPQAVAATPSADSTSHHPLMEEAGTSEEGATSSTSASEDEASIQGVCSHCHARFTASVARYKCMNCLEVVLCESCELKCVHNPIHLLVKLRQPLSQLSLKQQLIFTSYIEDGKERTIAKAQNKVIRRAMRESKENALKNKEERMKARKERIKRRVSVRKTKLDEQREKRAEKLRLKKASKKEKESAAQSDAIVAQNAMSSADVDVVPLISMESAMLFIPTVAPTPVDLVEEGESSTMTSSISSDLMVDPVNDPAPQQAVEEEISLKEENSEDDDDELAAMMQSAVVILPELEEETNSAVDVNNNFDDINSILMNVGQSIEIEEKEEDSSPEVTEEKIVDDQGQAWNMLSLVNSIKQLTGIHNAGQDTTVNVNDYRIQGIAFTKKLDELEAMGFTDRSKNIVVLMKHLSNLERAVEELISS